MVINSYFQSDQGKAMGQSGHIWMVSFEKQIFKSEGKIFFMSDWLSRWEGLGEVHMTEANITQV